MKPSRRVLRVDANSTLEEMSPSGAMRSVTDGSLVALVYEAEDVRGERSLVFESVARTVKVRTYPPTWHKATDLDLLALRDAHRANREQRG